MLVTGASGFLGRHLVGGSAADRWEMIAPASVSIDIRRRDSTIDAIRSWKPTVVVNLAYVRADRRVTVDGAAHVAAGAAACRARLIHMSTDVVFPGRLAPYTEADEPRPLIAYGRDKLDAERAVRTHHDDATIVRTSLLYGTDRLSSGQRSLRDELSGGAARTGTTFFTDEIRAPAPAADVAAALATLADLADAPRLLHVAGPDALSRAELAQRFADHLGLDAGRIRTGTIAESGQNRPDRVVLDSGAAAAIGIRCRSIDDALGRQA